MFKITKYIAVGLLLIGCTDYSSQVDADYEEWREKQLAIAVDSIAANMTLDTVTLKKVDTLKTTVRDTIILNKTKVQTDTVVVNKTKHDTVIVKDTVTKVDTLFRKDTVIHVQTNTVHDTVKVRVVDTIMSLPVSNIHKVLDIDADNPDLPHDTLITLSIVINNMEMRRTFSGRVYKNIFYDTTLYAYSDDIYRLYNTKKEDISSSQYNEYVMSPQCGLVTPLSHGVWNYTHTAYSANSIIARRGVQKYYFNGWRMLDDTDISHLTNVYQYIIPNGITVLAESPKKMTQLFNGLSSDSYPLQVCDDQGNLSGEIMPKYYMCAYDLTQVE